MDSGKPETCVGEKSMTYGHYRGMKLSHFFSSGHSALKQIPGNLSSVQIQQPGLLFIAVCIGNNNSLNSPLTIIVSVTLYSKKRSCSHELLRFFVGA